MATANRKVFDVRRPGKAPASPTSRPVVAGHKPKAQAAQASVSGVGAPERPVMMDSKKKIEIKPPTGADNGVSTAPTVGWRPQTNPMPDREEVKPAPAAPIAQKPAPASAPAPAESDDQPAPHPAQDVAAKPAPAATFQPVAFGQDPDDPVQSTAAPDIEHHQAVVSQHKTGGSAWHTILLILVILILAAVAADILVDADVIKAPAGIPHTDFI